jgi:multiple antibiotic resistance protein
MAAPINLSFIFAIFFLTLGPLKLIPTFYGVTQGLDGKARIGLALKSATLAFLILVVAAVVGSALAANWRISREALVITGGFLLLIGSLKILSSVLAPPTPEAPAPPADPAARRPISIVISPLAIPGVVTPWGLVAVLLFVSIAEDQNRLGGVAAVLVLIMLLNILGMIFAGPVMRTVGLPAMSVLGWVFSILQAALGITFMLRGVAGVAGIPWHSTPL